MDPVAQDGLGGMPSRNVAVAWEVAEDAGMRTVVARGVEHARIETAHSVHVELKGLRPGREYFYRFRTGRHLSRVGRTLTSPALHETPAALAMAFASCAQYEHGYFTAYARLAQDHPDLVLHLGDYLYEYKKDSYVIGGGNPRDHEGPETTSLAGYRQRHAHYKADADLQAAHTGRAACRGRHDHRRGAGEMAAGRLEDSTLKKNPTPVSECVELRAELDILTVKKSHGAV